MKISDNKVVVLHYQLRKDNAEGVIIEETFGKEPLGFIFGQGMMIPDFEKNLDGRQAGDAFAFGIKAENAYGMIDENRIVSIPKEHFKVEGKVQEDVLFKGNILHMQDQNGNPLQGMILDIADESVRMDFNHPMAGQDLHFTGTIKTVRNATAEELSHGHVHGEGGHKH